MIRDYNLRKKSNKSLPIGNILFRNVHKYFIFITLVFFLSTIKIQSLFGKPDSPKRQAIARYTRIAPRIDGRVDKVWLTAPENKGFLQHSPVQGKPATNDTHFYVMYDHNNIYFLFIMLDTDPTSIPARLVDRDHRFDPDDSINLYLDTYHDNRKAFYFSTNPRGVEQDGLISENGDNVDLTWDGIFKVAARINDYGWVAEFAIPFKTLRFNDKLKDQVWGFNVWRVRKKSREISFWSLVDQNYRIYRLDKGGILVGIRNIQSGQQLNMLPYFTAKMDNKAQNIQKTQMNLGLDLKYSLSSDLTLDITFNPDFGQVEIDEEQINLDKRFEVQLEEKRPFFLENTNLFQSPYYQLFYSRRIGVESDIKSGVKVTGKVGPYSVGILGASTGSWDNYGLGDPDSEPTDEIFSVARIQRDILASSNIGIMLVDRRANLGGHSYHYNNTGGMDWSIYKGQQYFIGQTVYSYNSMEDKWGGAGYGQVGYYGRLFYFDFHATHYTPEFDVNATGFFPKLYNQGKTQVGLYADVHPLINYPIIRSWGVSIAPTFVRDSNEDEAGFGLQSTFWVEAADQSQFRVGFTRYRDVEVNFFDPTNQLTYWGSDFFTELNTDPGKMISFYIRWNYDSQYYFQSHTVGFNQGGESSVRFKLLSNAYLELGYKRRLFLDKQGHQMPIQDVGQSDIQIWTIRARYLLQKNLFSRGFVQYTNGAEELNISYNPLHLYYRVWDRISANLLLGWRFLPGSTIYFVYTSEWDKTNGKFHSTNQAFFFKISYLWSL